MKQSDASVYSVTGRAPTDTVLTSTTPMSAQAQTLASSIEGREQRRRFLAEMLGVEGFQSTVHSAAVASALESELTWLLDRAVAAPNLPDALFASRTAWVNSELEALYGLPRVSRGPTDFRAVDMPAGQRAGLITHPLVMTKLSHGNDAATILRGTLLLSRALCIDLPAPPPNAGTLEPRLPAGSTSRQKYAARIQNAECAGCHTLIDPVGFALDASTAKAGFSRMYRPMAVRRRLAPTSVTTSRVWLS